MSDFDKEAEREKLREKYERDQEERQTTQRMSDLLLKGATMTNAHCGTCGDPLFQQDDTTFCPSCHGNPDAVRGTDLEAQPAEESVDEAATETASEHDADRTPSSEAADESLTADARSSDGTETDRQHRQPSETSTTDDSRPSGEEASTTEAPSRDVRTPSSQSQPQTQAGPARRDTAATDDGRSTDRRASSSARPADGDLETARASLQRALEKFAREAAATDDPRYAKECLEAAREASETLETLR